MAYSLKVAIILLLACVPKEHLFCVGQSCTELSECEPLKWLYERKNDDGLKNKLDQFACPDRHNEAVMCPVIEVDDGPEEVLGVQNSSDVS